MRNIRHKPCGNILATITTQKMKFPLKISSENVTKSAGTYGFGHIY